MDVHRAEANRSGTRHRNFPSLDVRRVTLSNRNDRAWKTHRVEDNGPPPASFARRESSITQMKKVKSRRVVERNASSMVDYVPTWANTRINRNFVRDL